MYLLYGSTINIYTILMYLKLKYLLDRVHANAHDLRVFLSVLGEVLLETLLAHVFGVFFGNDKKKPLYYWTRASY